MGTAVCSVQLCAQMASFCKDNTIKLEYHLLSNILNTRPLVKVKKKKERASMLMKTLCFVSVRELGNVWQGATIALLW